MKEQKTLVIMRQDTEKFLEFAETHRTVLNQILRQSTTHLADGPFSVLVSVAATLQISMACLSIRSFDGYLKISLIFGIIFNQNYMYLYYS